jgi:tRNA (cytidine/uridine-2'-O-)-methyltransferase
MLHVALYQPEIPPNTGNIARQCVGMAARLHLIGPITFKLTDHALKRAGLDYWQHLDLELHPSPTAFLDWLGAVGREPWVVSKRGRIRYDQPAYADGDVLLFGKETSGLPKTWLERWAERSVFVPVIGPVRSYNLSNCVAVVLAQASLQAGIYNSPGL